MTPTFKNANAFLQTETGHLRSLLDKVKQLALLNQRVSLYVDPSIMKYCQVANVIENRLILIVANGSVATNIRFQSSDLLIKFKQDPILKDIKAIHCKVRPISPLPRFEQTKQRTMPPLSAQSAEIIREGAKGIADPKLRSIMEKIAGHALTKDGDPR